MGLRRNQKKIRKYLKANENKNTTIQYNKINEMPKKTVQKGNFIAMNTYIEKKERSQINHLNLYPKELEKEKKLSPKLAERGN